MRSHDEIFDSARDGSPFSNGTSGEIWMADWCYRCKVDGPFQRDETMEGCPLLLVALIGKTPAEWTEQEEPQDYHCSEFVPDDEDGDGPEPGPHPVAVIDGQVDMFEVFADQIADAPQQQAVTV